MRHANSETREPITCIQAHVLQTPPAPTDTRNCRRLSSQKKRKAPRGNYQTLINDARQDYLRRPSIAQQVGAAVRAVLREELGKVKVSASVQYVSWIEAAVSQFTRSRADSARATCRGCRRVLFVWSPTFKPRCVDSQRVRAAQITKVDTALCGKMITRVYCAADGVRPRISGPTYRNFFSADARWQFMDIQLTGTIRR